MLKRILAILTVLLAAVMIPAAYAVGFNERGLDSLLEDYIKSCGLTGLELAVSVDGQTVYEKGLGRTPEGSTVTENTPMYIGSVSKSFTALGVMQLVERGLVDLDAPVTDYIPWFKTAGEDGGANITIRNLLNHTSGLSDLTYLPELSDDAKLQEAVRALSDAAPVARPGVEFHYFNENYEILGLVIERVSGLSYSEYVRQNILEPLGMNTTYADKDGIESAVKQGFTSLFSIPVKRREPLLDYALPDGYIVSTAADMLKYLDANSGEADSGILSRAGFDALHTSTTKASDGYAMGWQVADSSKGYRVFYHGGDLDTYFAYVVMIPEHRVNIVLLSNQNSFAQGIFVYNSMILNIVDVVMGDAAAAAPRFRLYSLLLGGVMLVLVLLTVYSILKLPKWRQRQKLHAPARGIASAILDLLMLALLLDGIPMTVSKLIGRGFTLAEAFSMEPGLVGCLFFFSAAFGIKAILKLGMLAFGNRKDAQEQEDAA